MTNMTPQEPTLNRQSWRILEENVRKQFKEVQADMWVVNIAVYHANPDKIGNIPVPMGYWKIVYSPGKVDYYYANNKPQALVMKMQRVDVQKLVQDAGKF